MLRKLAIPKCDPPVSVQLSKDCSPEVQSDLPGRIPVSQHLEPKLMILRIWPQAKDNVGVSRQILFSPSLWPARRISPIFILLVPFKPKETDLTGILGVIKSTADSAAD